jgi:hypothetical protein
LIGSFDYAVRGAPFDAHAAQTKTITTAATTRPMRCMLRPFPERQPRYSPSVCHPFTGL